MHSERLPRELVLEALDRREDRVLSAIAAKRDTGQQKAIIHADDIWEKEVYED